MDIRADDYRNNEFVVGIDTEKELGASFSGYNSKAGDLTVLRFKPAYANTITTAGNLKLHYVLHYDSIMQIMDSVYLCLNEGDMKKTQKYIKI